ncbi:Oidioi.mRNA.OKI2018_I69.chr1.g1442.t1.cds [Oikopleura dioica]|uniref:Oidioi.mRNA.OKI2018_I69.chr1.g1442.t1.cds n=1 Tax=Oikopleura dioica TaxID=34765 RepID=A0ABN7SPM1_OIKDI|nr:Oidioi.mRNA.OKI2018_I69.chr1.g1442.t1.cds [Oikopleura dioica]
MEKILSETEQTTTTTDFTTTTTVSTSITTSSTTQTATTTVSINETESEKSETDVELPPFFKNFTESGIETNSSVILKSHQNSTIIEEELEIVQLVRVAAPTPDSVKGTLPSLILSTVILVLFSIF